MFNRLFRTISRKQINRDCAQRGEMGCWCNTTIPPDTDYSERQILWNGTSVLNHLALCTGPHISLYVWLLRMIKELVNNRTNKACQPASTDNHWEWFSMMMDMDDHLQRESSASFKKTNTLVQLGYMQSAWLDDCILTHIVGLWIGITKEFMFLA